MSAPSTVIGWLTETFSLLFGRAGRALQRRLRVEEPRRAERAAGRLVELDVELVERQDEGRQRLGVDPRAGRDRVVGARGRGELVALGEDDVAAPAEQVPDGHADDDARQGQVEEQVAGLAEVAGLGGDARPSCECSRNRLRFRTARAAASASSGERVVVTSACSSSRLQPGGGARRRRAQRRQVHLRARHDAADEGDEEQQVDRREPRRRVDVEEAELVEPRRARRVLRDVVGDPAGVDVALREDRARARRRSRAAGAGRAPCACSSAGASPSGASRRRRASGASAPDGRAASPCVCVGRPRRPARPSRLLGRRGRPGGGLGRSRVGVGAHVRSPPGSR